MIYCVVVFAIIFILLLSVYVYKESNGYHVIKYSLDDNRLNSDKFSFVYLSDLHNRQYGIRNIDLINDIDKLNPDCVILGGDMITASVKKWEDYSDTLSFIKQLSQKYNVYYGIGNHEERLKRRPDRFPEDAYEVFSKSLDEMGAPLIDNTYISLPEFGVDIWGLNLDHYYYRKVVTRKIPDGYIDNILGRPDTNNYSILLAHNPEHFLSYGQWGADLVLSGHVHGGIIRLPLLGGVVSPALKLFPKYDGGKFINGDSTMILSRGIGTHTIPIRINNKAELIFVEINKNKQK